MGYSEKGQGHIQNFVYKVEGFVLEYNKGEGLFCKKAREWEGS